MTNILRALTEKSDNMQEQVGKERGRNTKK